MECEEESWGVRWAFASLAPEVRAALWLHVIEQKGLREVATCLATSRSTIHRRIRGGILKMKRLLTPPS